MIAWNPATEGSGIGSRFTAHIGVLITYKISYALVAQRISADRYER